MNNKPRNPNPGPNQEKKHHGDDPSLWSYKESLLMSVFATAGTMDRLIQDAAWIEIITLS